MTNVAPGTVLFEYSTSHRIEQLGDSLLRKDLRQEALIGDALLAKSTPEHDPRREPVVYTQLLRRTGIGPHCVEAGADWIIIERIDANVLWQIADPAIWIGVAGWLASMHARLAHLPTTGLPLLRYDGSLAAMRADRARRCGLHEDVIAAHARATRRLLKVPATIIHGEFYPSNVLVAERASDCGTVGSAVHRSGVFPVDWELAGLGPAALDIAALTAGWPEDSSTRRLMEEAYFAAAGVENEDWDEYHDNLLAARLQLCIQWLGWPRRTTPSAHRHDWLAEAIELSRQL